MGLETGEYITDLVLANPLSSDLKHQGDDHLRLLKKTVQQSFPNINAPVLWTPTDFGLFNPSAGGSITGDTSLNGSLLLGDTTLMGLGSVGLSRRSSNNILYMQGDTSGIIFLDNSQNTLMALTPTLINFYKDTSYADNIHSYWGAGNALDIYHDGANSAINNNAGQLTISNKAVSGLTVIQGDNSGGILRNVASFGGATPNTILYVDGIEAMRTVSNTIRCASMPTSAAGLSAGDLWRNGNVVNIV